MSPVAIRDCQLSQTIPSLDRSISKPLTSLPNGHVPERTACRKDNLPKIGMLFRQNVWDCDSFLNCVKFSTIV